jgi:P4 family phage/plasmid primase-like protien
MYMVERGKEGGQDIVSADFLKSSGNTEEGKFFVFHVDGKPGANYLVEVDEDAMYLNTVYIGSASALLSETKEDFEKAITEALNRLKQSGVLISRDGLVRLIEFMRNGGYETFTEDLINIDTALDLLNELNKTTRLSERVTIAAEYLVDAAIEHFDYVKNFTTPEGVDLGIHCWDGKRYRKCEDDVKMWLEDVYRALGLEYYGVRYKVLREEIMARLEDRTREKVEYEPMMIAFNNCVFDWETLECLPHDPERVVFHYIPHDLDVNVLKEALINGVTEELAAKYTPKTLRAFKDWVGDKWIQLYEILGAILYPRPIKKAVLFTGPTDSGKSTCISFYKECIGKENYAAVPLQALTSMDGRFIASMIYGKLADFWADLPEKVIEDVGMFKVLTGGDSIYIDKKHKEPFTWTPYTKFIFSANEPPPVTNADEAFWNRWVVVEFTRAFPQKIENFEKSLIDEIPRALAIAIAAFKAVLDRGSFSFEDTPEDAKFKWMSRSNSVFAFIQWLRSNKALIEDPAGRVRVSELYRYYTMWCQVNGRNALRQNAFTSELKREGFEIRKPERRSTIIGYRLDTETLNKLLGEEDRGLLGSSDGETDSGGQ